MYSNSSYKAYIKGKAKELEDINRVLGRIWDAAGAGAVSVEINADEWVSINGALYDRKRAIEDELPEMNGEGYENL